MVQRFVMGRTVSMSRNEKLLVQVAIKAAREKDHRKFRLGAVGIRKDGTLVTSCNGPAQLFDLKAKAPNPAPAAHAEARLLRKMDKGGVLIVVRVRKDGSLGEAMPCHHCLRSIRARGIRKVMHSTADGSIASFIP